MINPHGVEVPDDMPESERDDVELALGHDHWLHFFTGGTEERIGAIVLHRQPRSESGWCIGGIQWGLTEFAKEHPDRLSEHERNRPLWTLRSMDPLHVEPSLLCRARMPDEADCGDHGFIRAGQWEPA